MEELLYKIDKIDNKEHRKILPMLFPNYVNIFPVKLSEENITKLFKTDKSFFINLLPAVIKNKWSLESINYDFEAGELLLDTTTEEIPLITIDESQLTNPELYAYNKYKTPDFSDYLFCKGIYIAAEKLGIVTGHSKLERNTISIFAEDSEFKSISLKSLEIVFQLELFSHYIDKNIVFVTGGTGIGKTSQIPKLLFWFDTLFAWNNDNNNYHTLLSLPKKQLVDFFGENFNNSINSVSYLHKYYYGSEGHIKDNSKTKIIVCTNKISSKRFLHSDSKNKISSVVLDEIHESDIHTVINLCLIKKYRRLFGCVILMSATPGENLLHLNKYFTSVKVMSLPNIQLHKITMYDMYNPDLEYTELVKNAIKKYTPKKNEAGVVFCSTVMEINKLNEYLKPLFKSIKLINIYSKSETLKSDIDSIDNISDPIIILSTNLLESSITIKKLKYVYDLGKTINIDFYRVAKYYISEESMLQRRGRVGRVSPGKYIKLYDKLGTYNFLKHTFLYPIIIFDKVYKFRSIYSFDEEIKKMYKVEQKYFDKVYRDFANDYILKLYNNNLCTSLESILVYTLPYSISNQYKEIENKSKRDIYNTKLDVSKIQKIAKKINIQLIAMKYAFKFTEEFYKNQYIITPLVIGSSGKSFFFITPNLVIKM